MRTLNALLAGATAVVLVLLATRASSVRVGAVVGLLFALDPFCIRQNDRVLLETALMFWVMLGYLVFTSMIGRLPSRRDWLSAVGAGLLFGCAALTKDEGALLTVLPLLAAAALRWGPWLSLDLAHRRHHCGGLRGLRGRGGRQWILQRPMADQDVWCPTDARPGPDRQLQHLIKRGYLGLPHR